MTAATPMINRGKMSVRRVRRVMGPLCDDDVALRWAAEEAQEGEEEGETGGPGREIHISTSDAVPVSAPASVLACFPGGGDTSSLSTVVSMAVPVA
jgi:hypothetical protein